MRFNKQITYGNPLEVTQYQVQKYNQKKKYNTKCPIIRASSTPQMEGLALHGYGEPLDGGEDPWLGVALNLLLPWELQGWKKQREKKRRD